jgi:hypothetical protein
MTLANVRLREPLCLRDASQEVTAAAEAAAAVGAAIVMAGEDVVASASNAMLGIASTGAIVIESASTEADVAATPNAPSTSSALLLRLKPDPLRSSPTPSFALTLPT